MSLPTYDMPRSAAIFSFAALKSKQREIKDRAKQEVVHITENGNAAYIFCSEDVFAHAQAQAIEDALYDLRVANVFERGEADFAAGRTYQGTEVARAEVEKRLRNKGITQ